MDFNLPFTKVAYGSTRRVGISFFHCVFKFWIIFSGSQPLLVPRASLRLWSESPMRVRRQEGARPLQRRNGLELLRPARHGQG